MMADRKECTVENCHTLTICQSMSKLYLIVVQLILWTSIPRSLTASQISPKPPRLSIVYLADRPLTTRTKTSLVQFESKLASSTRLNQTVQLTTQVLSQNATTVLDTLRVLNKCVRWEETEVIIVNLNDEKVKKMVLCGYRGLVFDIKTRPRDMQQTSYNVFTVKPSLTRLHEAVEKIFGEIGYTKMHEVECFSRQKSEISKMKQTLENIKASSHTFIFVKCLENLDLILQHAYVIGLTTSDFRWVFPAVLTLKEISKNLPQNVIAIDLPGSGDRLQPMGEGNSLFLGDVLNVLEKTLEDNFEDLLAEKVWNSARFTTSLKRYIANEQFPGDTGDVLFNADGQRSGETYEISELITFNGVRQWLPIGSLEKGNVRILFNQWRLEDNIPGKPVLRVVTRLEPPYLMFGSVQDRTSTGECEIGRVCRHFTTPNDNFTIGVETTPTDVSTNTSGTLATNYESVPTNFENKCCTGLIIDLLERLEGDVGFESKIHLVKDGMFGSNDPKTRRWNGMIGELVRNEADMAASTLTITAKRSKVVDFTYPYVDIANGILVSTQPVSHDVWDFVFLDTFSGSLWLALFIAIQIVIGILWLAECLRKRRRSLNFPHKRDNSISCAQIINYTWSLVFQKASEEVGPNTLGGRTVAAFFAFCTIIACSSFTANLAAIKVTTKDVISISGIRDTKFQNGGITFGTLANSANLDFFRDSTDPSFQRIYKRIKGNVVSTYEAGAQKVISREWTAFIADTPQLAHLVSKQNDCGLKITGDPFFFSGYGIALRKNSTWNTRLSLAITTLVRKGFISNLQAKWLATGCVNEQHPETEKMGIDDIGGAFLIVSFGCIASGIFLLLEYVVWYVLNRKEMVQGNEARKKKSVDHAFGALVKVFTLWDITNTTSTNHQTPTEATLKNFKTLDIHQRNNQETFQNITRENEH